MTEPKLYTASQMHVYACIIEELVAPTYQGETVPPWNEWRDQNGINELREAAMAFVEPCDADWSRAYALYEESQSLPGPIAEPGSFDYEFVPLWLRTKVDWSDAMQAPRLLGAAGMASAAPSEPVRSSDDSLAGVLACPQCKDTGHLYDRADVRYDPDARDWVVGDREGTIECTECDWSGQESELGCVPAKETSNG